MVYGADRIVQMPVMQLYDTGLMQQAINNARYMYEKAEKRMDDFYKEYDNFITPIQRDQDWYNENVIGKFRKGIDELYARGEDPLRTASGRAKLAALTRSIDVGTVNKLRTSADNAREFLKARKQLEAAGLYNPLFAKYDGPDINSYSTLESGAWDKMSPTKMVDMATFGNPYYEGMVGNRHSASKNGIDYTIESITMDDLKGIANAHFNELVSTPQGQMMYKYYRDLAGGDANPNADEAARIAFNNAVADGQRRRMYVRDDYKDNYFKFKELELARDRNALARERNNIARAKLAGSSSSSGSGNKSNKELASYYQPLYQNLVINTLNKDPMRSATFSNDEFTLSMGDSVLGAQRNIAEQYFGKNIYGGSVTTTQSKGLSGLFNTIGIGHGNVYSNAMSKISNVTPNRTVDPSISSSKDFRKTFNANYRNYLNQFTGGNSAGFSAMFANTWKHGSAKVDALSYAGKNVDKIKGQNFVAFDSSDIDNVYSAKEIAARMAGITGPVLDDAIRATQRIRKRLKEVGEIAMKATSPIGCGDGATGQYGIYSNMKFKYFDGGDAKIIEDAVLRTPFMSTPNPNASKDDRLNLAFDQNLDLEQKIMDNAALKQFGVSSNSGSADATIPSPEVWYNSMPGDFESDFDFDF